jgi:hypothetical protein
MIGSNMSVRSYSRLGSALSIYGLINLGSHMSVLDYSILSSSLSVRN